MRVVVDRIEGELAVLQVGEHAVDWPVAHLPADVAEGAVLEVTFTRQDAATTDASARLARLRARGPSGSDIDL